MNFIKQNILDTGIIASTGEYPDYNYHWTRDSAIIINFILDEYLITNKREYYEIINKYINIELKHSFFNCGEPKFNLDNTPYHGEWGRPQNDGSALRGIVFLKLYDIFPYDLRIKIILDRDINYTIDNINEPCFDIWEEIYGYHFYTRILQTKFMYECIKKFNRTNIIITFHKSLENLSHHIKNDIISSFDIHGNILRVYDSSFLLGLIHIDYDKNIVFINDKIHNYITNLIHEFNYPINYKKNIHFIGRYKDDVYFKGNPWLITTIARYNYELLFNKIDNNELERFLLFVNNKKILSEQIDKDTGENKSAKNLTWNYVELLKLKKSLIKR